MRLQGMPGVTTRIFCSAVCWAALALAGCESQAATQIEFEIRHNAVEAAEARIRANEAAIRIAQINLERSTIHSPLDGRAGERLVDVGNVVTDKDEKPLLVITRLSPIYADFT